MSKDTNLGYRYSDETIKNFNNYNFIAGLIFANAIILSKELKHTSTTPVTILTISLNGTSFKVIVKSSGITINDLKLNV